MCCKYTETYNTSQDPERIIFDFSLRIYSLSYINTLAYLYDILYIRKSDITYRMEWGKMEVYQLRKRLGMNQQEFADYIGTRQATVSHWETGTTKPTRMARRLLTILSEREDLRERQLKDKPEES